MDVLQVLNIFANAIICLGMTAFFVLLFGNTHSVVQKWPVLQHWSLKIGLVTIIASSAWNAMNVAYRMIAPKSADVIVTFNNTPIGEIFLNIGLAVLFCWVVYFHKYHFLKVAPPKAPAKKAKKKSRKAIKK
jgi:hypothetical protein